MSTIFANKVRKALHKKIKGYSNCWVENDILVADIQLNSTAYFICTFVQKYVISLCLNNFKIKEG